MTCKMVYMKNHSWSNLQKLRLMFQNNYYSELFVKSNLNHYNQEYHWRIQLKLSCQASRLQLTPSNGFAKMFDVSTPSPYVLLTTRTPTYQTYILNLTTNLNPHPSTLKRHSHTSNLPWKKDKRR